MSLLDDLNPIKQLISPAKDVGKMISSVFVWFDGRSDKEDQRVEKLVAALRKSDVELEHACKRLIGGSVPADVIRQVMLSHRGNKIDKLRAYARAKPFIDVERRRVGWRGIMRYAWVRAVGLAVPVLIMIMSIGFIVLGAGVDGAIPKSESHLANVGLLMLWSTMWVMILAPMLYMLCDQAVARGLVGTRIR